MVIIISFAAFIAFVLAVVGYASKTGVTMTLVEVVDIYNFHPKQNQDQYAFSELDNHDQRMSHQ